MNKIDRGLLVGMVLGDGHLSVRNRLKDGKYKYESSEIRIVHSIKQIDYLKYKAEIIRKIFGGKFTVKTFTHLLPLVSNKKYSMCGFSKSNKYFRILKKIICSNGKKYISRRALNMLTPHGIAIWFMDDGSITANKNKDGFISSISLSIATCCSEIEAITIQEYFYEEYGIVFKIDRDKRLSEGNQYSVRANTFMAHEFVEMINRYVIPSMRYKLKYVADLKSHERQTPLGKCKECGDYYYKARNKLCSKCYSRWYYHTICKFR